MKIVLISTFVIVLSIALGSCNADPKQGKPSRIEREAAQLLRSVDIRGKAEAHNLIRFIQVRAHIYNKELWILKNRVDEKLRLLGNGGTEIRTQLDNEVRNIVDALSREFSFQNLQPKISAILSSLSQYTEPIKSDINDLISAIQANPENAKCWDENKKELQSLINGLLKHIQNIVREELGQLNTQIINVGKTINETVTQLEKKLKDECSTDISCYVNYFKDNLPKLLEDLNALRDQVKTAINGALENLQLKISKALEEAFSSDYNNIKQKIKECIV